MEVKIVLHSASKNKDMKKKYTKTQICEAIAYWQNVLESYNESQSVKHAYLDYVLPKNGIALYDDNGKKLDFGFKLNDGMAKGWTGISKDGHVECLCDRKSGYDGKNISILLLAKFLKDYGYELVDER